MFKKIFTTLTIASCLASVNAQAQNDVEQPKQPNVVIMMVDNLGWGELTSYGSMRGVETKNLDKLADEGIRLQNFNTEPQCTPTRSSFLTGRRALRSGTDKVVWGMDYGMVNWEVTMAELFKQQGYETAMYGKWHLGDIEGRLPTDQGFDEWYGVANTTDESEYTSQQGFKPVNPKPMIVQGTAGNEPVPVKEYNLTTRRTIDGELTDLAIANIEKNVKENKPFFTVVTFTQPHLPTIPHPDFAGITGKGDYSDVVYEIDHRAGQIVDAITQAGARDNTLIIWMSDNGPEWHTPHQGVSGVWRGAYFTALEGSLRTPFIASMPGTIEQGNVSNEIVHVVDMMATLAPVAGFDLPKDRTIDSINQWQFLKGEQTQSNRDGFAVNNGAELYAYKWENFKMHFIEQNFMPEKGKKLQIPAIFNLIDDPKEEFDLKNKATWVLPIVLEKVVKFKKSLAVSPDTIPFPAPRGYTPNVEGFDFSKQHVDGFRQGQ